MLEVSKEEGKKANRPNSGIVMIFPHNLSHSIYSFYRVTIKEFKLDS